MGIPILRGRTFNPALRLKQANEIIVDQLFVHNFLPNEEPIGKHVHTMGQGLRDRRRGR